MITIILIIPVSKRLQLKQAKRENEEKVFANLYGDLIYLKPKNPKFSIVDKVRISKYKRRVFDKAYTQNWTGEI